MSKAELIYRFKHDGPDGEIIEMVIWRLPPSVHALKYRLFYGRNGVRIVGYDNERGKGDHKHIRDQELPYTFIDIDQLIADFKADVRQERGGRMTILQVHVGMSLDEMGDRFIHAYKSAEAGQAVNERHLSFTSLEDLARALTPARLALLRHLHQNRASDVRQLATALQRDYKNVHQDVRMLEERGLIHRDDAVGLQTDFDEIRFDGRIAL